MKMVKKIEDEEEEYEDDDEDEEEEDEEDEEDEEKEEEESRKKAGRPKKKAEKTSCPWQYYTQQAFSGFRNDETKEFIAEPEAIRRILNLCEEIVKNTR